MLMSYLELLGLVENGAIKGSSTSMINASSIDVTLGNVFLKETGLPGGKELPLLSLSDNEALNHERIELNPGESIYLYPGEFVLAQTAEVFDLPSWVSAEYKMRSTMARMGLEQLGADWCGAGWSNSVLTLELKNMTQLHVIELKPGDKIGQMVFFSHKHVPQSRMYNGLYNNNNLETAASKVEPPAQFSLLFQPESEQEIVAEQSKKGKRK